jgi:hypothetical protein
MLGKRLMPDLVKLLGRQMLWRATARKRARQSRQRPGPPRYDPTRLALSAVSEGERARIVVSRPHRRQPYRHAQDHDRRAGTQTGYCALALCHHWRDIGGRHPASGRLKGPGRVSPYLFGARAGFSADCRIDDPRWREAVFEYGTDADRENGPGASPPMRMTASWSGSNDPTANKSVARRYPQWRAHLGSFNRQAPSDAEAMQKAPVAVHHRSACSGVEALRNTSHAKAASRQALLAFRSLDPFRALREPDRRRRDEERPSDHSGPPEAGPSGPRSNWEQCSGSADVVGSRRRV